MPISGTGFIPNFIPVAAKESMFEVDAVKICETYCNFSTLHDLCPMPTLTALSPCLRRYAYAYGSQ